LLSELNGRARHSVPHSAKQDANVIPSKTNVIPLPGATDDLVRIEPGDDYTAFYIRHVGMRIFGGLRTPTLKVRVDFRLVEHPNLILARWYRVHNYAGGRIRASAHGDLVREISAVLGTRVRPDRVPMSLLEGIIVRVSVHDVVNDHRQERIAEVNRYSIIGRLLGKEL
jgi:hypothetical protein